MTAPTLRAQVCTGNVNLTTQASVDAFTCTEVTGNLSISGSAINNLNALSTLTKVGGNLYIGLNPGLLNLDGLAQLTLVGGSVDISFNNALANLDGLAHLTSVGGTLYIGVNRVLPNLDGLAQLTSVGGAVDISFNNALANLDGLARLTSVGGTLYIGVNGVLKNIGGLAKLTSVGGSLDISYNNSLDEFCGLFGLLDGDGLSGGYYVYENAANPTKADIIAAGPCLIDSDGDGVDDSLDLCPDSILSPTVWIGDCDTGVSNEIDGTQVDEDGCSLADHVTKALINAAGGTRNHGQFVSAMAKYLNGLVKLGILSWEEHEALMGCIGQADETLLVPVP